MRRSWLQKWLMEHDTKTDKKSKTTGTLPKSFYTPIDNGSENLFAATPSALYGGVLLAAAVAYLILQQAIIAAQGLDSPLQVAIGRDWKGKISPVVYLCEIVSTFLWPWVAQVLYVAAALMWLVPDRRIEKTLHADGT
jgi:TMEM175 potassium channel family protein